MIPSSSRVVRTALVLLLCGGVGLLGVTPVTTSASTGDHGQLGRDAGYADGETAVSAEIDCNRSAVTVTAPETYQYHLTTAVVNLTPTTSTTTRSTVALATGNSTVTFAGSGVVFAFVQDDLTADEPTTTSVQNCGVGVQLDERATEMGKPVETVPRIQIDCNESLVRFVAPENAEYTASIADTAVSPTSSSTNRLTRTFRGNATLTVTNTELVSVFASPGRLGDERTISAVRTCRFTNRSRGSDETQRF